MSNNIDVKKNKIIVGFAIMTMLTVSFYFISKDVLLPSLILLILPIPLLTLYILITKPRVTFIAVLFANYFAVGLSRYVPAPMGLSVDALLIIAWISLIFSQFNNKIEWKNAGKDYTYFAIVWFIMTFFQLFNPEAVSREAWFYAMRAQGLYIVLTIPLVYIVFNQPKDLDLFVRLCAWFTLLAVLKGLMQKYYGVDQWESKWLNQPGNFRTHILFGQLRIFSFFSDAGTYGGSMGYFGAVFIILANHEINKKRKYFYLTIGFLSIYAMLISGTRSAIAVPLTSLVIYTILTKRIKIMISVGVVVFVVFFFLKFTTIGQGNYDIRRMRSAFDDNNASLNVRLENRILFGEYLKTRPFGGGIGSSGNWGMRFSPNTFLAQTATDGWYIQLWAEQGVVGLTFYIVFLLYGVFRSSYLILFKIKKSIYLYKAIALTSGMYGLMVSSYSASSLGQMPNTIIVFTSITLISLIPKWEKKETLAEK